MKEKSYVPNYSKGEIVVHFKDEPRDVESIVEFLGYNYLGKGLLEGHIVGVPKGEENKAIGRFTSNEKKISFAYRRDLKYEERYNFLKDIKKELENIEEEQPDFKFKSDLEEVVKKINKFIS